MSSIKIQGTCMGTHAEKAFPPTGGRRSEGPRQGSFPARAGVAFVGANENPARKSGGADVPLMSEHAQHLGVPKKFQKRAGGKVLESAARVM